MTDKENTLILETSKGKVVIEMRPDLAPGHVARIKELGATTGVEPKTAVILHVNDTFGQGIMKGVDALWDKQQVPIKILDRIGYDVRARDLSVEVAKAKAVGADLLMPITRVSDAILIIREMVKQNWSPMGIISPGSPGPYEKAFTDALGKYGDGYMSCVPWYNPTNKRAREIASRFEKEMDARFDLNAASRIRGKIIDDVLAENQAVKELGKFSMARTQSWRDDVRTGMQALLLQNQGKINGIWASFDGQAYIIDDLLKAQGVKKGQIPLVSMDGGPESFRRIADPDSTFIATVNVPFEEMGRKAVQAVDTIVVKKQPKSTITAGPYLFMDATLVDQGNVKQFLN